VTAAGASPAAGRSLGAEPRPGAGVLVIGYGNTLRSDDGVGPTVAARLAADPRMAGADIREEHQLTPELAVDVSRAALLVLIDAGADEAPGEVSVRWLETGGEHSGEAGYGPAAEPGAAMTHHVDPAGIVGLARELWGTAPPVVMVSIGPESLEVGEGLSEVVERAAARAAEAVVDIVEAHARA
jgi:hydrogenase maturation protease